MRFSSRSPWKLGKSLKIGGKIGDYNRMAWAALYSGLLYESMGDLKEMLEYTLKGLKYAEKTDSYYVQSMIYANITRAYAKLGDSKHMDEFGESFTKLFADAIRTASKLAQAVGTRTEAVVFAAKNQRDEANNHFDRCLQLYQGAMYPMVHEAMTRTNYAWALRKQGRIADARTQIEEATKLYQKLGSKPNVERLESMLKKINEPT